MHFSKTYAQLLLTLPPELRASAIQYRQLKKIINEIVAELTALGLSPDVLHRVVQPLPVSDDKRTSKQDASSLTFQSSLSAIPPRVIYELAPVADHLEPRLRLYLHDDVLQSDSSLSSVPSDSSESTVAAPIPLNALPVTLAPAPPSESDSSLELEPPDLPSAEQGSATSKELIIPLVHETNFFRTLSEALESLSAYLTVKRSDFESTVQNLSEDISSVALPSSSTSSFQPYSRFSDAARVSVSHNSLALTHKSDLETWREIFQMYVEADIFQGHQERFRGERDVEDAEARLAAFSAKLQERIARGDLKLKMKRSGIALKTFMDLNTFILDLRKFQHGTAEATRKILKKHAKRTALPLAPDLASPFTVPTSGSNDRAVVLTRSTLRHDEPLSLSLLLVQALTETLLPIIPHIDDYSCVICTSLAFKPIRLRCSHLFCVRCLVKLQKRGEEHCPMCRASTVLSADRSNVDWALLNFMKDWFPVESRKKLQQNEREVAEEELQEMGLDIRGCVIM